jgi:pimeloyl-ACP methyl ester carboxylesterase
VRETNASAGGSDARTPAGEHPIRRSALAYDRGGAGEPLVLLHGLGSSRRSWDPVLPGLVGEREVIAVDLPGHGDSPLDRTRPGHTPGDLADSVGELLDDLGFGVVHLGGNSLGGWVALELARRGRAGTVTAFSPAGLWKRSAPAYIRMSLRQSRVNARLVHRLAPDAPRTRLARALFFAQVSAHPTRVPYGPGRRAVHDMASTSGFRQVLRGLENGHFRGGAEIHVPVTVIFGVGDQVLGARSARRREQMPAHTRWFDLTGSGHMPMLDDPPAVAGLLLEGSGSDRLRPPG